MRILGVVMVLVATSAYADVGANVPEGRCWLSDGRWRVPRHRPR